MDNHSQLLTPRGLERRLKRNFLKNRQQFAAITTPGFEHQLKSELSEIEGVEVSDLISGGVEFCGPQDLIYSTNLCLRTANRILMRIGTFTACSYPELYNKCRRIDWELYCGFSNAVSFSVSSRNSRLHHTDNIGKTVFDALSEHMKNLGVHISNDPDAGIVFHVRIFQDECTISIDSSGDLLYKRGYRLKTAFAPMRETIAGAVLMLARWNRYSVILDPMCGSGVLILEAVSMALRKPPGINRSFAFMNWPAFNSQKWEKIRSKATGEELEHTEKRFFASDIDEEAIISARENASRLGVTDFVEISKQDCLTIKPVTSPGLLISNLPYGKRIGSSESGLHEFFAKLGKHLCRQFSGWDFAFIVEDPDFAEISGLRISKEIRFKNGGISVRLVMGRI